MLSAVFGRWMGYLVLVGRLLRLDDRSSRSLWLVRLLRAGPRHADEPRPARAASPRGSRSRAAWTPRRAYETFTNYPGRAVGASRTTSADAVGAVGHRRRAPRSSPSRPTRSSGSTGGRPRRRSRHAVHGRRHPVRAPTARSRSRSRRRYFIGGGPLITVSLYHDSGSVPRYSYMFLGGSILLFGAAPAAAGPRREEAQGVPDRRRRAALVRPAHRRGEDDDDRCRGPPPRSGERAVHPVRRDDHRGLLVLWITIAK